MQTELKDGKYEIGLRDMQDNVKEEFQKEGQNNWAKASFKGIKTKYFQNCFKYLSGDSGNPSNSKQGK